MKPTTSSSPVPPDRRAARALLPERAQSTVEYALMLLGAAALALAVIAWVTQSGAIGTLFDAVLSRVMSSAS